MNILNYLYATTDVSSEQEIDWNIETSVGGSQHNSKLVDNATRLFGAASDAIEHQVEGLEAAFATVH
jgi:hypothetical protein